MAVRKNARTGLGRLRQGLAGPLPWRLAPWVLTAMLGLQAVFCLPWIRRERESAFAEVEARLVQAVQTELRSVGAAASSNGMLARVSARVPELRGGILQVAGRDLDRLGVGADLASAPGERTFLPSGEYTLVLPLSTGGRLAARLNASGVTARLQGFVIDLFLILGPAALVATLITVLMLVSAVVVPLQRLEHELVQANPDLSPELSAAGSDEVERMRSLLNAFNAARARAEEAKRLVHEASEARTQFFASVTHELRTPLHSITGYCEILAQDLVASDHAELAQDVDRITENANRLLAMINNVLTMAKIEAGRVTVVLEDIEVDALVAAVRSTIDPLMKKGGNRFVVEVAPELTAVRADRSMLLQCLVNLLGNAAKHTRAGEVTLSVLREQSSRGEEFVFAIADSGGGISALDLATIFEPYKQGRDEGAAQGTGLGLAIVRRFAEQMGGEVSATSELGRGSRFVLRLPASGFSAA